MTEKKTTTKKDFIVKKGDTSEVTFRISIKEILLLRLFSLYSNKENNIPQETRDKILTSYPVSYTHLTLPTSDLV